ncbi:MAG: Crp/Fnr family transcriptional regulator [Anaerovoracaceae bacterium]|jgi:CRP-like cAMP-binding protein
MELYFHILEKMSLFKDIEKENLLSMLECLSARKVKFRKGEYVFQAEDKVDYVGAVLAGSIKIIKEDLWGNRTIIATAFPGELFAEAYSCAEMDSITVSVVASEDSEVLLIDYKKIIYTCSSSCVFHSKLIENMIKVLAKRNIQLIQKINILGQRNTREKLLAYLGDQAKEAGSKYFDIPFNRQELADYLCVDRSAMSSELGKLRDEGILEFERSHFLLKL